MSLRLYTFGIVLLTLVGMNRLSAVESLQKPNRDNAVGLFKKYCFDCHSEGVSKGDVALDVWLNSGFSLERTGDWQRAWKIVRHEFMPPTGKPQPTVDERQMLTEWMAQDMLGVDFTKPDPGRVTLRRLNRLEYEHSVQDLFGSSFGADQEYSSDVSAAGSPTLKLRDRLPPDETAFGLIIWVIF